MPLDEDQIANLESELNALVSPSTEDVLYHSQDYDAGIVGAIATRIALAGSVGGVYQPVDADLTAIAALTTTAFGRGLLALANQAALLSAAGAAAAAHAHAGEDVTSGTVADARIASTIARDSEVTSAVAALSSVYQPLDSDLTSIAALTTTSFGRGLLALADASAARTALALVPGTDVQALDATLTALAAANWAANALPIGTGADTLAQTAFAASTFPARASTGNLVAKAITDFGLSLVDDTDQATAKVTLGFGSGFGSNASLPAGAIAQSFPREWGMADGVTIANQRVIAHPIMLPAGRVVTSISYVSGSVALVAGVHQYFALYASSKARLAMTADDTSAAWAANTVKTLNLSSPFTTTYDGLYYVAILIDAGTVPTMIGCSATASGTPPAVLRTIVPELNLIYNAQTSPPNPLVVASGSAGVFYFYLS